MINYVRGNIFDSDCEAIVNTVNCKGVAGKGLALQFRKKYPKMFLVYKEACANDLVKPGKCHVWENPTGLPRLIINFPTKDDWRKSSCNSFISTGLADLHTIIKDRGIKSISIPALGCTNGGLEWPVVKFLLESFAILVADDVRLVVYEPQ